THSAVLDVQEEQQRLGEQNRDIYAVVVDLQKKLDLMQRELRPRDSLSIRSETERRLVSEVVARFRRLPEGERYGRPALRNAIGKLEVAAGEFAAASEDFAAVAAAVSDQQAQGEAHFNAYRAHLERRDWDAALQQLLAAVRCDARRFAPFPMGK